MTTEVTPPLHGQPQGQPDGPPPTTAVASAGATAEAPVPLLLERRGRRGAPRVAVWGHYYGPNLGDEMVTEVVIQAVRARRPDAEVVAISLDPEDTRARHHVPAYPLVQAHTRPKKRRGFARLAAGLLRRAGTVAREVPHLWSSYRMLRRIDLMVVAGSGQLLDQWNGPWGHPYAIYKWSVLARLTGTKVAILSVGAGPLQGRLARAFVRSAVEHAGYVSVRDASSKRVLHAAGVRRPLPVVPDMGFEFHPRHAPRHPSKKTVVGINVMAHAHPEYWGRGDLQRYEDYIAKMTRVACDLLAQGIGVELFSSHATADTHAMNDVVAEAWATDPRLASRLVRQFVHDVDGLVRVIGGYDAVIAARYHSIALPILMGIPVVATAYHPKDMDLMRMVGHSEYCLPDIDTFEAAELTQRINRLLAERTRVRESMAARVPQLSAAVAHQFDVILRSASTEHGAAVHPRAPQPERGRHVA